MANNANFYKNIVPVASFSDIMELSYYRDVPESWYIVMTDITNSTQAIGKGKYKEINIIGAAPIIGILNQISSNLIPFAFGGDGVTLVVPESLLPLTRDVIRNTIEVASTQYDLVLRAGIVRVKDIAEAGETLLIGKFKVSEAYSQALFFGGGLALVEKWLKNGNDKIERIFSKKIDTVSYEGLECRWQPIKSELDYTISLLIKSTSNDKTHQIELYKDYLSFFERVFGNTNPINHPVNAPNLFMNSSINGIIAEVKIRTFGLKWFQKLHFAIDTKIRIHIGKYLIRKKVATKNTEWGNYTADLIANSDFRKFDEMIRQVISCTSDQLKEIEQWLEERYKRKELVYGIHVADSALITCMVFQYDKSHIHFVDGNNGGYTAAAIELKKRAKQIQQDNA